jgi:subtilisin family serine protease
MAKKKIRRTSPGYVPGRFAAPKTPPYVIVELRHDSQIALSAAGFGAPAVAEKKATDLNLILNQFKVRKIASHFGMSARALRRRATQAPPSLEEAVSGDFAQSGFAQMVVRDRKKRRELVKRLNRMSAVWKAVEAPSPVPAAIATGSSAASRNFEPCQGYLDAAPNGIGARAVWQHDGGKGRGARICDIEGAWNRDHEDLPATIPLLGGSEIPNLGWRNHGTAVLGEMVSRPGDTGTVGIAYNARAAVQSAVVGGVFNAAAAIRNAARNLNAGDVILIELQATGPNGKYVAMQFWDDIFSAIRLAVDKGISVVEAAGNGNENFDLAVFRNTGLQRDSGAIVVGAGIPPTNYFDNRGAGPGTGYTEIGVPRSRIWFSNYGRILDVQAWGYHVATLGYGDAQGGEERKWYTLRFSGTSSASPIVTGAVACIQGRAQAKLGHPLTPAQVRQLLIDTGTPQAAGPTTPITQHIGPQPNLERAFEDI